MPAVPLHIVATGLNHRTAPVAVREQVAFRRYELEPALHALAGRPGVAEAAILSTCNRAEVYVASPDAAAAADELSGFMSEYHEVPADEVGPHLYCHCDVDAARHLFRVAAGVDSLVLGESEILGQVKEALASAEAAGTSRTMLNELFQRSLHLGKVARTETGIGRGRVSVASVAVELAQSVYGELAGHGALVVGAGETSEQTLEHLVAAGVESVVVANRTHDRAVALAARHGGRAVQFDVFADELERSDVVISASAAPHPILTVEKLRPALERRHGRPLFIVDIAVPRDVEPEVGELPNVYLFGIDDLEQIAEQYRRERERETARVEALIEAELKRYQRWLEARSAAPLIRDLRARTDALCREETERWLRKLPDLDEGEREVVRRMMQSFANKLLHSPMAALHELPARENGVDEIHVARRLFGLHRREDER